MTLARVFGAALLWLTLGASAAPVQGVDYELLASPQPPTTQGKVEVIEFFSYGCPHCYHLHPLLSKWKAELPSNAVLIKVPLSLGHREWGQLVRAYYTLEATGDLARLDDVIFDAIHKNGRPLYDEDSLAAWAAENGIDATKFRNQFNSPEVTAKASRAEQMAREYKVSSTPSVIVDGKYRVGGKTYDDMLKNARQLIDKAAAEKK